jgi:hypothetical protein
MDFSAALLGALGGFLIFAMEIVQLRKVARADRPDFKEIIYWTPIVIYPLLGGVLVSAYSASRPTPLDPWTCVIMGLTGPSLYLNVVKGARVAPLELDDKDQ